MAIDMNNPYIRHYCKLVREYSSPGQLQREINLDFTHKTQRTFQHQLDDDPYGKLGTYYRINPELRRPKFTEVAMLYESDRLTLTQYRTGSHSLRIESGRWTRIAREERRCKYGPTVQTIDHVIFDYPLMEQYRLNDIINIHDFFHHDGAVLFINHSKLIL